MAALPPATYGTNGAGWSESLIGAYRFNDVFSVLGGISKADPGNYDNGNGVQVPYTEEDLLSGMLKFEITPDEDHTFKFSGITYDNDFFANSYFQNVKNQTLAASYSYTPDNELIDFRANAYWNRLKMKYDTDVRGGGTAAGRQIIDTGKGFDISNTSLFDLGDVAVRANYGVEYFRDDYDVINSTARPSGGVNGGGSQCHDRRLQHDDLHLRHRRPDGRACATTTTASTARAPLSPATRSAFRQVPTQLTSPMDTSIRASRLRSTLRTGSSPT